MASFTSAIHRGEFALSAELPLTPDTARRELLSMSDGLAPYTHAVQVADNRFGRVHMSPVAAAAILLQAGHDPIMELCCRNRNRVALLSDLLGARELGVNNLVLLRGKKAPNEFRGKKQIVIDTQVHELIGMANKVYRDEHRASADDFILATNATVHEPDQQANPETLNTKITAGAQLLQTQICLDIELLKRYVAHLRAKQITRKVFIVVQTTPLLSYQAAAELRAQLSHSIIPDSVMRRLESASDQRRAGVEICAEFINELQTVPGVHGAHLSNAASPEDIVEVLREAAIKPM